MANEENVVLLTCEQPLRPVEVEAVFKSFPSTKEPDSYNLTCRTAGNHLKCREHVDHSACSPDCRIPLHMTEDRRGYNIVLRASRNNTILETKTFHLTPVSLSSFTVFSTTTTAHLKWKLHRQQSISTLTLFNLHTQSVAQVFNMNSSEIKSQLTIKGLQPGTSFEAVVTVVHTPLDIALTQKLSIFLETAQCPRGWLADGRNCYAVRRSGLTWGDAVHSCTNLAAGSHLADLKTSKDQLFVSSYLLNDDKLLLLWTGLNDQQEEGHPLWSDGSSYNGTDAATSLLPARQTDCFAFHRNATGQGYFLTPFFCDIALPFICQYQTPSESVSFSFELAQVTEQQVELRWSDPFPFNSLNNSYFKTFLLYQKMENGEPGHSDEDGCREPGEYKVKKSQQSLKNITRVRISLSSRQFTVTGLSPGSIYSFHLQASHSAGLKWSLGQIQIAHMRPLPPQNITVGSITAGQISVHWMLPNVPCKDLWSFVVRYEDMLSRREKVLTEVSRASGTSRLQSYAASIGGLESHRKYRVEVLTVTRQGVWSCGQVPLTLQTAVKAPTDLVVFSMRRNLSLCWTITPDHPADGYYITSHLLSNLTTSSLWMNQSSFWGNESACVDLGTFTPGQTYELGVTALRGNNRSERSSIRHTTAPMPVQVAVPHSVGTNNTQLYIQPPTEGLLDGVKVCACPGVCDDLCKESCGYKCDWHSLSADAHTLTISNLSPGSQYQLGVYSTSKQQMGPPYFTVPIKTSLATPSRLREGMVTDSSIELLWDPAQGEAHSYEVTCFNCGHSLKVEKVFSQSAVFSNLTPGLLYRFAVRTEKESFTDSSPVTINITAAPESVELSLVNKTTTSMYISWTRARGQVSTLVLSIKNRTSTQERLICNQEPSSYSFEGLAPGSQYTIEAVTTSGKRRGKAVNVTLHTIPEVPREVTLSEQALTSMFVTWRPPPGQTEKYKLLFGLLSLDRKSWIEVLIQSTNYEIRDLIPGSDYGISIQSVLGSDFSRAAEREFTTRPAGLCALRVDEVNSSSVSVNWDGAHGDFDFYRVTVANTSITKTLTIPKKAQVAVVTGLLDGCSYNVSAERVRGGMAGAAASLTVTTVPTRVRGLRVVNVSARAFSLRWRQTLGCVDHYQVSLQPNQGKVVFHHVRDGYMQVDAMNVSPGTQYTATVTAASSSNISPGVSRMITTNESVPGPPLDLEGEAVGSNGILLSWTMPPDANNIDGYIIRYKEVCPYPDPSFTQVTKYLDIPETLLTDFTSGSTYQIQVAAVSPAGIGALSKPLYIKTAESPPGLVTNLTAYAQNHTSVMVTWFLPHRINGLITKFAVKAKHARTGQTVRTLEVNAEEIMTGALPHCNDAADILSRATLRPLEITASSPPITLSAVPPAASWSVPISVGVDQLRPYTAYLFEVSAFTSDGEGQIASTMVRMPESAPEDPPQNLSIINMTSRSISVSWSSPTIFTGKFTYMLYLYGPTGFLYDNSTWDMRFLFTGLTPYTRYRIAVRAKAAGEVGPAAEDVVITPAEAPSAVQDLTAVAEDSVSIRVSWRIPAQPNGPITQYRLQVLVSDSLLQEITLTAESTTGLYADETLPPDVYNSLGRRKRSTEFGPITSPPAFMATVSDRTLPTDMTSFSFTHSERRSTDHVANTDAKPTADPAVIESDSQSYSNTQSSSDAAFGTSTFSVTSIPPNTLPPWLVEQSQTQEVTSDTSALTPGQLRLSTRDASVTGHSSTRSATLSASTGVTVREAVVDVFAEELSYLVSDLSPFTEYTFRVSASTTVGEGPPTDTTEKTSEQVPSSVLEVSYQNISSTSILVSWVPPLNPNGRITHYTIYGLTLHNNQALKWVTNSTSMLISDLDKYTAYKLRVAASTVVGESSLSEEDDIFVYTLEDEPDSPPENLAVVDTSPSTATLTWSAPKKANGMIQHYEVLYENETYSALINTTSNRSTLISLKPFSYYNVSVRAYTRYGHGNQTSDTLYLLSGEDVPGSPPYDLTYESVSPDEVNVTWWPPLLPNGVITHYSLELWNSTHSLNLSSSTTSIHITDLRKYAQYRIVVQAHTRAGSGNHSSEPLNITTLEDAPDAPPQFLHARKLSDYEVELSWQPPLQANSDILYYIVRVWNDTTELWQNVTETSVVINVDSESRYNASVSSWTRLEPSDPPQNVTFVNVTASSVTLSWQPPTEPNGIIVHYTIYYTVNNTVMKQRVPVSDLPPRVSPSSPFIYTLPSLTGGSNYTIWMASSTLQGDGAVQSEPFTLLLPEDVPSDPVSNLTAQNFSSTAIIVSWDPPTEPNGRPYYLLTLQEAGIFSDITSQGTPAVNKTTNKTTKDNVYLFTRLRKHFPYVLTVTPATGAGPAYNHTSTMYLRTDDDIPSSPPLLVSTRNLSSSSIAVVWQRPLEANGEITEYALTLSGPGGSNTTQTPNTSAILTNLLPYTAYNLTIIAATRKGAGTSLLLLQLHTDESGPMSPPRNLTIFNHTAVSVWLSWEPPLEPNGLVIKYGFRIRDLSTNTVTHRNSSGSTATEYLSGFRPYSSYEISVYSFTRVGHGDQFSSPVTFTTNESVSDAVGNLSCSGLSWDSIQLSWDAPVNPNGQILLYEIVVEADEYAFTHQAHTPEFTLAGLSPDQEYTLVVAAVNSAGAGNRANCSASTLSESVPAAPRFLTISRVTPSNVTLGWSPPHSIPGLLKEYHIVAQLLSTVCEPNTPIFAQPAPEDDPASDCVDSNFTVSVNASDGAKDNSVTLQFLAKYRYYRFKVAAVTNAGAGEYTPWNYTRTLAGNPDAPPRDLKVTPTSTGLRIAWEAPAVLSGPTSYLVKVDGPDVNISMVRAPGELTTVVVTNLTAFTRYTVTIIAYTGSLEHAGRNGKAIGPVYFQTLEEEPKDPPKNVTVSVIPEEVKSLRVSFSPPQEPNGNITAYFVYVYEKNQLIKNISLNGIHGENETMVAVIEGLKGGHTYSVQISATNGAGRSPLSPHVQITTGIKAPSKPIQRPQAELGHGGVAMVTHRSITIRMPACFYSDDNGPIAKIQVIVAELGVRDIENTTDWRSAFFHHAAPYMTDAGFPNPPSPARLNHTTAGTYVIGENDGCMEENNTDHFCNGPLKPNMVYVFKFRATNINGQCTDSEYSDHVRTAADGLLTREEQIILGVLLSFFLAVLLIIIICGSVKIHQRKKEGGTYSPREAEIIETKCKLDQLIAVADMELKQEKLNRYSSFFFRRKEIYVIQLLSYRKSLKPVNKKSFLQHIEDLCANDNARFQEEFGELPKLLQDLATTDADLPWNKSKNRFPNLKPYNNNRVKLLSEQGTAGSDYINASFVSGYLCPNEFIATQGPLPGTVADFWRMIWETGTRTIVMLTQCYEKGRIRCQKYWPEDNKPMTVFSDILISKVSEEVFHDWTVRTLKVEKYGHYILIRHFNYTSWPEHGVPESCSTFIKFVKAVRAHRHDNTTITVHCSAGVGRTGVFVALDHLIQHVRDHDFVDVYGLVAELRSERMCMVQNLAQYIFLHQSTLELLNNKGNSQSIWFVSYSALEKMDSLDAMEGDVELEWEETTM
ncbi:phosphatidylinositol phosphatase PTPRQ [Cololabis saira]|uniref:phosphatidylinositol phosphatase PTPRQ n=1 Tax=Cololabis saira TaxID=129043 RepID=UPI002AD1ED2D|nr:phosphatidylinositol phosphatase PTPRQ [Cololabis saira]